MFTKTPLTLATVSLAGILLLAPIFAETSDARGRVRCDRESLVAFGSSVEGKALLCAAPSGVFARIRTAGLVPGDAYTVWWVYIDDPASCIAPNECALEDFSGENPLPVFGRMDSLVARSRGRGTFSDRLRDFRPSAGSQIWLLVFGHGPADDDDNRHRARQLLTPEDPHAGAPHLGNFVDGPLGFPVAVAQFHFP